MRNLFTIAFFGLVILLVGLPCAGTAHQPDAFAEVATGEGTLTSDGNSLHIKAVSVLLRENAEAEICLMTSTENVYAGGRWFRGNRTADAITLEIIDDTAGSCIAGHGAVFLQDGCVPISGLQMTMWRPDGVKYEAEFITKLSRPCTNP